jgi:chemosensory pili system protein ChpA (sensor histidine kinase/response regulator)
MDGYELSSALRSDESYQHTPIIMLTSRSEEKHRKKAFESGATEYLVKPYQEDVLIDLIRKLSHKSS